MYYVIVCPEDTSIPNWLCVSSLCIDPGTMVDFVMTRKDSVTKYRGEVINYLWVSGENTNDTLFCRQLWAKSPVGEILAYYFRRELDPVPAVEPAEEPVSFFPSEEELEAAAAEEVEGAHE